MFSFLIKKAFFDFWDHFFTVFILNLGYFILIAFNYFSLLLTWKALVIAALPVKISYLIFFALIVVQIFILFIYTGIVSSITKDLSDYKTPQFSDAFIYLKKIIKPSALYAFIFLLFSLISYLAVMFYSKIRITERFYLFKSFPIILVFWIIIISLLASQYYYALQSMFGSNVFKNIKKMFLLMFDNPGFTIGLFIGIIAISILSVFTIFVFLGPAMIMLWFNTALKLRMYKYDYFEKNPEADKRKIPWDILLYEDKEKVGKRTLKSLFFPWKDLND